MDKTIFKFQFRGVGFSNEESKASKKPDQSIITEMTGPGLNQVFFDFQLAHLEFI